MGAPVRRADGGNRGSATAFARTVLVVEVSPRQRERSWGWSRWERVLLGCVGLFAVAGALWLTTVMRFMFAAARCEAASLREALGIGILYGAGWAIGAGVLLALAISLLRVGMGGRGLQASGWLAVPAVMAAVAVVYGAVSFASQPTTADRCQVIQLR